MISRLTIEEIKDKQKEIFGDAWETAFDNLTTENNELVSGYFDGDEFYTDGEHYVPLDDVKECILWKDALVYIIENGEYNDFMEAQFNVVVERAVKHCYSVTVTDEELQNMYIDYVSENADLFFEWLWEQRNDKN